MTVDHAGMMPALHLQFRQLYYDGRSRWHDACTALAVSPTVLWRSITLAWCLHCTCSFANCTMTVYHAGMMPALHLQFRQLYYDGLSRWHHAGMMPAGMMPALHLQFRQLYYDGLSRWHDACTALAVSPTVLWRSITLAWCLHCTCSFANCTMTVYHAGMMPALHLQFRQLYYDGLSRWHDACTALAVSPTVLWRSITLAWCLHCSCSCECHAGMSDWRNVVIADGFVSNNGSCIFFLKVSVSRKLQALVYDILTWGKVPESDARSVCLTHSGSVRHWPF